MLQVFLYVSTAYCCCDTAEVEEKLYPMKLNPHDIINFVNNLPKDVIEKVALEYVSETVKCEQSCHDRILLK